MKTNLHFLFLAAVITTNAVSANEHQHLQHSKKRTFEQATACNPKGGECRKNAHCCSGLMCDTGGFCGENQSGCEGFGEPCKETKDCCSGMTCALCPPSPFDDDDSHCENLCVGN